MHIDAAAVRDLVAGPGVDSRQWSTYGQVMADQEGQRSVILDDPENPGPMVLVKLLHSGMQVPCRVGMACGGDGEGEWHPFVAGDEVLVEIPDGNERSIPVITHRLANAIDRFPSMVAGNDTSTNSFAFKRVRVPYIFETASSYLLYSAPTKSFLALTEAGAFTVSNADKALLQLGADVIGFRNGDADCFVEIHVGDKRLHLEAGSAKLQLADGGDGIFLVPGMLTISTSGAQPIGHGVTVEQVYAIANELMATIGVALTAVVGPVSAVGAAITAALALDVAATATVATAKSKTFLPTFTAALTAALVAPPTGVGAGIPGLQLG